MVLLKVSLGLWYVINKITCLFECNIKKFTWLTYGLISVIIIFGLGLALKRYHFGVTYQETTSMPEGWYLYYPITKKLKLGDVVLFNPPKFAEKIMIKHNWIGPNMPMMKHVMAVPGDFVCIKNNAVYIQHKKIGPVYMDYAKRKALPHLHLCGILPDNEFMLMSTLIPNSFDSRYFGPIKRNKIFARVIKV
jgi:conjugative transfer signal peptidase TraF